MKVVEFVLNHLYGIGNIKTFTNGKIAPKAKIARNVFTTKKYVCNSCLTSYGQLGN
jgi:hypothetical protein